MPDRYPYAPGALTGSGFTWATLTARPGEPAELLHLVPPGSWRALAACGRRQAGNDTPRMRPYAYCPLCRERNGGQAP